jgi:hypothetical protein
MSRTQKFLAPRGFAPAGRTPELWKHTTWDLLFSLIVGGFGAHCTNRSDAGRLISALNKGCKTHADWKGEQCLGLALKLGCRIARVAFPWRDMSNELWNTQNIWSQTNLSTLPTTIGP